MRSAWRSRDSCSRPLVMKRSNIARIAVGLAVRRPSNVSRGIDTSVASVSARQVAFRGALARSAISPMSVPGPRTANRTSLPADSLRTSISPVVMT